MQDNLVDLVKKAGVVGAGGAGFPTHVKLAAKAEIVIINGAECEPLLRVDQQLMARRAEDLMKALDLLIDHLGAKEGVIALKEHYHDAVEALNKAKGSHPRIRIHLMGSFYPAGDEQVLVYEVTGKIVPEGGIPLNVGAVVTNVETALNVLGASDDHSVTDKYVTITGAVNTPKTVIVPIGTPIAEVIKMAGGATVPNFKIINGGPMMGQLNTIDQFVTKTTKGLILVPEGHPLLVSLERPVESSVKSAAIACMQCSLCTEVCPRSLIGHRLEPHKLMRLAGYGSLCDPKMTPMNAYLCVGCRLCEYACVMELQPWKLNANLKKILASEGIRNELKDKPECARPFRDHKRFPVSKLIKMLGLTDYDRPAPMDDSLTQVKKVVIPLRQSAGVPSVACVAVGDEVNKGDLIAAVPEEKLGSNIHASISGKVTAVSETSITLQA